MKWKLEDYSDTCLKIHTYLPTYLPTYIHTYIHTYMHACMHACIHTHTHTCMRTYIGLRVCGFTSWLLVQNHGYYFITGVQIGATTRCVSAFPSSHRQARYAVYGLGFTVVLQHAPKNCHQPAQEDGFWSAILGILEKPLYLNAMSNPKFYPAYKPYTSPS